MSGVCQVPTCAAETPQVPVVQILDYFCFKTQAESEIVRLTSCMRGHLQWRRYKPRKLESCFNKIFRPVLFSFSVLIFNPLLLAM